MWFSVHLPHLLHYLNFHPRFAVTKFTYRKNGGKIPVTEGKTGNYRLPMGKLSLPAAIFGGKGKLEKVNCGKLFYAY